MPRRGQRKCPHCGQLYVPDHRNRYHQVYCSKPDCRQASKRASRRRWRNSSKGRDYFKGPTQVERVRQWRLEHPCYWRNHIRKLRQRPIALQDLLIPETLLAKGFNLKSTGLLSQRTLQDLLFLQNDILNGLILKLTAPSHHGALQDLIVSGRHRLILLARQARGPTHANRQTTSVPGKAT